MNKEDIEEKFIQMIRQHERIIYKACSFYANKENPLSDLIQDVIVNLWNGYGKFRGESLESTWIYRIALNTCITHVRKDIRKPQTISLSILSDTFAEAESKNDQLNELYRLIHQLKTMEKAIVLLWLEEKTYQEIAEITGLSLSNVATKLRRIKQKLVEMSNE